MTRHKRPRAKLLRSLYVWHRYIGLAAALFVVMLAVTGILLNHTEDLELDSRYSSSEHLLDWYGIHAPDVAASYEVGAALLAEMGDQIYWNTSLIPEVTGSLIGAVEYAGIVIAGVDAKLLLLTHEGELIEILGGTAGVPAGMQALGITPDNKLAIHSAHGYYQTDVNFLKWRETETLEANWAVQTRPSDTLHTELKILYRGSGLSMERVLLDLHSGRILGSWGVYLMDAAAILFLLLAISGVWLWGKRRASARAHQRHMDQGKRHPT